MDIIRGKGHKVGSNVDTDVIIPGRYCHITDLGELTKHFFEDYQHSFGDKVKYGDIIVAENNFGCGSSRELAPLVIKAKGVSVVIAKSFARIFFRNSINIGLPILELQDGIDSINDGDMLEVNLEQAVVRNLSNSQIHHGVQYPDFIKEIISSGGLMNYVKKKYQL
jgi:3-isopropylmalate/(R)-2-methylmalate dehydratase small subunit